MVGGESIPPIFPLKCARFYMFCPYANIFPYISPTVKRGYRMSKPRQAVFSAHSCGEIATFEERQVPSKTTFCSTYRQVRIFSPIFPLCISQSCMRPSVVGGLAVAVGNDPNALIIQTSLVLKTRAHTCMQRATTTNHKSGVSSVNRGSYLL